MDMKKGKAKIAMMVRGWISPHIIRQIQQDLEQGTAPRDVWVGCVTTDAALQNVLQQIRCTCWGGKVSSTLIQEFRSCILCCHSCFRTTLT